TGSTEVAIVPQEPLLPSTVFTIGVNGVTDLAGNAVTPSSTTFTTASGPDTLSPQAVSMSLENNSSAVPVNSALFVRMSEPIDPTSIGAGVSLYEYNGTYPAGSKSLSADGRTVTFTPTLTLDPQQLFVLYANGLRDITHNPNVGNTYYYFSTSSAS